MALLHPTHSPVDLPGVRLGTVRGISYGLFGPPDDFVQPARAIGAGLLRVYLYWGQVEPRPGEYVWDTVDALLHQLDDAAEVWITVCSSSRWATRQPTDFLPPSPARDLATYGEFVRRLVRHCAGRVRFWQCDNEPSNTGMLWAGTAAEYVAQLHTFATAVRAADPTAAVVLGGCGYDVFSSEPGSAARQFFDHVAAAGRDAFDLFSVNLYGDPRRIPEFVATARQFMTAHAYCRPIVVGELGGPVVFEFPEAEAVTQQIFASAFAEAPASQSTEELMARARAETPERRAMATLYAHMPELPTRLQMFMAGCPPELEAARDRINCCQLVMRNVLALAEGIRRTAYWCLGPEVPGPTDHLQMMHLLFGKLPLLDYTGNTLGSRHPAAETFARLVEQLAGVEQVTRVPIADRPSVDAFRVDRADRDPLLVLWDQRDPLDGDAAPPVSVCWPWPAPAATAVDALGSSCSVAVEAGQVHLEVAYTPIFVAPARPVDR